MVKRNYIKSFIQKILTPWLSHSSQERVALFHEVLADQWRAWEQFISLLDSLPHHERVMLSFDDGFFSSYQAIKKLTPHKVTFFVCPEFINRARTNSWQSFFYHNLRRTESLRDQKFIEAVRPASWEELRELVRLGHTIGSHTMTHAQLSNNISEKELAREIIGSADIIEDKLQVKVEDFAYPFGDLRSIDERAYRLIKRRYQYCYTGIRGNNVEHTNPYAMWRDNVHLDWPLDHISFLLQGGFDMRYVLQRKRILRMLKDLV